MILSFHNFKSEKSLELLIIVVKKKIDQKIGAKLLNKSISDLKKENKKLKFVNVVTLKTFKKSINFYKRINLNLLKQSIIDYI